MRITGGELGGRRLRVPRGRRVRPTQDRVRESLFGSLAAAVAGARFLDLYAGAGSVGFEALSRGAAAVTWVERAPPVLAVLRANVAALGADPRAVVASDVSRLLARGNANPPYDLVYVDPPYGQLGASTDGRGGRRAPPRGTLPGLLDALAGKRWLADDACVLLEIDAHEGLDVPAGWTITAERHYGRTRVIVLRGEP